MSVSCDNHAKVYENRKLKARKRHWCCACSEAIEPGFNYHKVAVLGDDRWFNYKRCIRCEAIHAHLVEHLKETHGRYQIGEWPDEKLNCGHTYQEAHECNPPEHIAALAFALPGAL